MASGNASTQHPPPSSSSTTTTTAAPITTTATTTTTPSTSGNFDMPKLFQPPQNSNPNPNTNANGPPFPTFLYPYPPHSLPHSAPATPTSPNQGAHLMAILDGVPQPSSLETAASLPSPSSGEFPPASSATAPLKTPTGRHLAAGDRAAYDVDARSSGDPQPPQLEVSPITKYLSDPDLVLGRQIAVNDTYICYGLKLGTIRVLNNNTALRSLLKGHAQRVTDMAFFAEDVHLLASASSDGRIFIRKINEGSDDSDKPQITEKVVVAMQIEMNKQPVHPRICWHCHKQEILAIGIGNYVLKIDTNKLGKNESFSAERPLLFNLEKLIDWVQIIGKHEGEVTDLSMSQWMTTRLVSSSRDGTIKVWEDGKTIPLATVRPYDGQPVSSAAFVTAPHRPDHIMLIIGGPLNRELKIWVSSSGDEGWLLPGESGSWHCTQTLELRSSVSLVEDAFFNQVVALPRAGLIIVANTKQNAIYVIHVDYGPNPVSARMDYLSEFSVTMPILSLTATTDCLPDGAQVVQLYCVQTQAIQQYALNLSQCLPPDLETLESESEPHLSQSFEAPTLHALSTSESSHRNVESEISQVSTSGCETRIVSSAGSVVQENYGIQETVASSVENKTYSGVDPNEGHISPQSVPLGSDISRRLHSPGGSPKGLNQACLDDVSNQNTAERETEGHLPLITAVSETAAAMQSPHFYKLDNKAPHLITPSEILSGAMTSFDSTAVFQQPKADEIIVQEIVNHDRQLAIAETTVLGDSLVENEKPNIESSASKVDTLIECPSKMASVKRYSQTVDTGVSNDVGDCLHADSGEDSQMVLNDTSEKHMDSAAVVQSLDVKGKKPKLKKPPASEASYFPTSPLNSMDSSNDNASSSGAMFTDAMFSTIQDMQNTMSKMIAAQKEMQKQLSATVSIPVAKEGRRIEASLGRSMEKAIKGSADAVWARFQEENAKREKMERNRFQQLTTQLTNSMTRELPNIFERIMKKENSTIGQTVTRAVTPILEKTVSGVLADVLQPFQRSVGEKTVAQLEKSINSKLENVLGRQIHSQFQSSGKQALQEGLRSTLETSVIPAFEKSCKVMFEQVDSTLQKGMADHTAAAQKQLESSNTTLAVTLRDAIISASSITQTLTNELAEGQRKLLTFLSTGNQNLLNTMAVQKGIDTLGGLPAGEVPVDPKKELMRLASGHKFEEAFTLALQRSDVSIVSWLCSQVDLQGICSMVPLPLSQGVVLALFQQLACGLSNDTSQKLGWMTEVATLIDPKDPTTGVHLRQVFEQIYQILIHRRSLPTTSPSQASSIRLILHVINSVLISCK